MVVTTVCFLLVAIALVIWRLILGPTIYDRILSMNLCGTLIVVMIALISFLFNEWAYIDIALTYGLMNFITTIALLRYFRHGSFNSGGEE